MSAGPSDVDRLRVPPHSVEAEQSVLGCLLTEPAAYGRISDILDASDFFRVEHRTIFGAIANIISSGQQVDIITVHAQLDGETLDFGGLKYLNQLATSVPSAGNVRRYAEIVAERSTLRAVIAASDEIAAKAFRGDADPGSLLDEAKSALAQIDQQRKAPTRRIPIMRLSELQEASHSVSWLVKHVLPAEAIGMLYGGSGTFKSFIAIDAALHVAHGLPWLGRSTRKGSVLYIAAEGGHGLWRRVDAWHRLRRLRWQEAPLVVVPSAVDLGADSWRVVDAAQAVGVTPELVVVDTLSQTYSGEENSANEMAAYLRELGLRFRQLWQCTVLLIHHNGHSATERPRGSSAIRANVDFLLGVFRDEKEMLATLSCVKQKDGEQFDDETFSLLTYELGTDEDGDRVTSLVARHLSSAEEVGDAVEHEAKAGRGGRNQLLLKLLGIGAIKEQQLRTAFYQDCGIEGTDHKRQAYHRAMSWAEKNGFAERVGEMVLALKKGSKGA